MDELLESIYNVNPRRLPPKVVNPAILSVLREQLRAQDPLRLAQMDLAQARTKQALAKAAGPQIPDVDFELPGLPEEMRPVIGQRYAGSMSITPDQATSRDEPIPGSPDYYPRDIYEPIYGESKRPVKTFRELLNITQAMKAVGAPPQLIANIVEELTGLGPNRMIQQQQLEERKRSAQEREAGSRAALLERRRSEQERDKDRDELRGIRASQAEQNAQLRALIAYQKAHPDDPRAQAAFMDLLFNSPEGGGITVNGKPLGGGGPRATVRPQPSQQDTDMMWSQLGLPPEAFAGPPTVSGPPESSLMAKGADYLSNLLELLASVNSKEFDLGTLSLREKRR